MYIGIHQSTLHSCHILIILELSGLIFEKYSNIIFHESPSSGAEWFHAGRRTSRHNDSESCFSQLCKELLNL